MAREERLPSTQSGLRIIFRCTKIGDLSRLTGGTSVLFPTRTTRSALTMRRSGNREHPVGGPGKRDTIAQYIRAAGFHWSNMRGIDFGPAAAVNQLQSGDRAPLVVGIENEVPEQAVSHDSGREVSDAIALLLKNEGVLPLLAKSGRRIDGLWLTDTCD